MIEISDGPLRARLSPQRGGIITSLRWGEREYLYLDQATFDDPAKNVRGGIPILFPICGPLRDGVWHYQGQEFRMPQHGLARQAHWQLLEQSEDRVEIGLKWSEETLKAYPFEFELRFSYSLSGRRLHLKQRHLNHGKQAMPFQTGLHPYFRVDAPHWQLPVSTVRDNEKPGTPARPFEGSIPEDWAVLDWEFAGLTAQEADLSHIRLHYDRHYRYLVVWHLTGKPFWCLEPWSGPRFGLQDQVDLLTCPPGGEITTVVEIEVQA